MSLTTFAGLLAVAGSVTAAPAAPSCLEISKAGPQVAIQQQFVTVGRVDKPENEYFEYLNLFVQTRADGVVSYCDARQPWGQPNTAPIKGDCNAKTSPDAPFYEKPTGDFTYDLKTGDFAVTLSWACKDESGKDTTFTATAKTVLPKHGKDGWNCSLKGDAIDTCTLAKPDVPLEAVVAGQ